MSINPLISNREVENMSINPLIYNRDREYVNQSIDLLKS